MRRAWSSSEVYRSIAVQPATICSVGTGEPGFEVLPGLLRIGFGALVAGFYQVQDDTGKIYVISNGGNVPPKGSRVSVSGHVTSGLTVGGRSFGTAIRENHHKIRW